MPLLWEILAVCLEEDELTCHTVALKHPVLSNHELEKIRSIDTGIFQAKTLQCYFRADGKPGSLKAGIDQALPLCNGCG